jgi:virginiamycin B lyase
MTQPRSIVVLFVLATLAHSAAAQCGVDRDCATVMDQGASIIILPKVVVGSGRDTIVQITNTSNARAYARCFYVTASGTNTAFDIQLSRQQPVLWAASQGRLPTNAPPGQVSNLVPATATPFAGDLLCVETDETGVPVLANRLTALATLYDTSTGDVAKYHAVGLMGDPDILVSGNVLHLGAGGEYSACPQTWSLDHLADGAADAIIGQGSAVHTNLTVVPCSQDLANQTPQSVQILFRITNQFEQALSASTSVTEWLDTPLGGIAASFTRALIATDYAQTQISTAPGQGGGFLIVAQEFHDSGAPTSLVSSAAINPHVQPQGSGQDTITLPATTPLPPGTAIFTAVTQGAGLAAITTGPDGNLWFTESNANQIGRIPPSGSPIDEFAVPTGNAAPTAITTGPDGNLWFTEGGANQVGRISTNGSVIREFAIGASASSITTGPDGNLWFTEPSTNSIGRISPGGTTLKEFALAAQVAQPTSITAGPDGNLWFTQNGMFALPDAIGRITPDGATVTEFNLPRLSGGPESIALGPDGNLWFVESGANQIGRITPAGTIREFAALASPTSIASVADGNLWFTSTQSFVPPPGTPCVLGRVTPAGVVTAFFHSCSPSITRGPDGNVWFLTSQPESIARFSP